jgi:mannitol/fructose-specific phosphotransferase system IIA component (Ntr-type)
VANLSSFLSSLVSSPRNRSSPFALINANTIILNLKGKTKVSIITELLDTLSTQGKLVERDIALKDLLDREQTMSTAIPNGIALPHAKTNAVRELTVTIGIKKSGVDFDSALDDKTRIIILALAPPRKTKSLYRFLLSIITALSDDAFRSKLLAAQTPKEIAELLRQYK